MLSFSLSPEDIELLRFYTTHSRQYKMVYPETIKAIGLTQWEDYPHPKVFEYKPHEFRDCDIDVEIECCGVCGSDIHGASGQWTKPYLPIAFGHEIVGKIVKIGPNAKQGLKLGDRVGIGAQVDADNTCRFCQSNMENYCPKFVPTYLGTNSNTGQNTIGGNASHIRVNSKFAFKIPENISSDHAAPLLCGGITALTPLLQAKVGKGTKVGIVGLGGIGSMAVQFAKALGAEVTVISRSYSKKEDAFKLGANNYISSSDKEAMEKNKGTLDVVVYTGSSFSQTSVEDILSLIVNLGQFKFITAPPSDQLLQLRPQPLLHTGISIQGTCLGTLSDIEYMLDLVSKNNIRPWVETVDINEKSLGECWVGAEQGKPHFRYVMTGYDKYFKN